MGKVCTVKTASQVKEQMEEFIHYIVYELKALDAALPDGLLDSVVWRLDEKKDNC